MVGASGFEPEASCAQGRLRSSRKHRLFNHSIEDLRLTSTAKMCPVVRKCGCLHIESLQKSLQSTTTETGATS
jgi:hypothetical protein